MVVFLSGHGVKGTNEKDGYLYVTTEGESFEQIQDEKKQKEVKQKLTKEERIFQKARERNLRAQNANRRRKEMEDKKIRDTEIEAKNRFKRHEDINSLGFTVSIAIALYGGASSN